MTELAKQRLKDDMQPELVGVTQCSGSKQNMHTTLASTNENNILNEQLSK